ncbi:type II secretion system F family protein [Microbacterium sp. STN6]|uniref:type II secretion system F family protein n=1 Tax=Microbacterium sp. STN6 TaxID=2995588 RepID=UPI002260C482|nr:type II secretion system F family protein [Microbacterium sp. STN6]MCX7520924.1 type II secretion system F family protein [Microbacterium sp. STN6]
MRGGPPQIEAVAAVVERLAVLLAGGVAPASAWGYLDDGSPMVAAAVAAAQGGEPIADGIARGAAASPAGETREAWSALAAAWSVASDSGAPMAESLRRLADSFRSLGLTQRELQIALSGPSATARMVMALPVIGILFGLALGFNTLQTLFTTLPGLVLLAAGSALMLVGSRWNRRMVRRATPRERTVGLATDLMAIAMSGGGSIEVSKRRLETAWHTYLGGKPTELAEIDEILDLAGRAGVPAAELLRSEAACRRRDARMEGQRVAAALAVRLMIPLGLCVLPAFMLVGVAPLLLSIVSSTIGVLG